MAVFTKMIGFPTSYTPEFDQWEIDPAGWHPGYFYEDPRMHRTDPFWQDYLGALTSDELREFRDQHGLQGRDHTVDAILASDWKGRVLIFCGEWES